MAHVIVLRRPVARPRGHCEVNDLEVLLQMRDPEVRFGGEWGIPGISLESYDRRIIKNVDMPMEERLVAWRCVALRGAAMEAGGSTDERLEACDLSHLADELDSVRLPPGMQALAGGGEGCAGFRDLGGTMYFAYLLQPEVDGPYCTDWKPRALSKYAYRVDEARGGTHFGYTWAPFGPAVARCKGRPVPGSDAPMAFIFKSVCKMIPDAVKEAAAKLLGAQRQWEQPFALVRSRRAPPCKSYATTGFCSEGAFCQFPHGAGGKGGTSARAHKGSSGKGGGGKGGGGKGGYKGGSQPPPTSQVARNPYALLALADEQEQQRARPGKHTAKEKERERDEGREKERRAEEEKERKDKKGKKDKKEDSAEQAVDRPCPAPEGYAAMVGARAAEWADLDGEEAARYIRGDIAELIHGFGVDNANAMPLLVHELCRVACACSDDGQRARICALLPALIDPDDGDPLVPVAHAVRGLGWFLATAACDSFAGRCPQLYSRYLVALRAVCPPETMYAEASRVFVVGLRALRALLEERGEQGRLAEHVQEIFEGAWGPLHDSFQAAATRAHPAEWQAALLAELVSMNSKTGWMDCRPAGGSLAPLLAVQVQRLAAAGLVGSERAASWREWLAHTAQEKARKKAGRDAAAALERLGCLFSAPPQARSPQHRPQRSARSPSPPAGEAPWADMLDSD
eukprot:TRINITY_DN4111_c2_g2_i3.p1 TRINITY_DN4111_c2_g2~~TRINITY_DN4111_c2_g2_i3.p1  ORF type:complete len:712 (+),score=186.58 TRINITY_DN4111_c2_g2_i3:83-2137(+)